MSMMMSCVCERAWTWDKFMNGRNHCKLQLLLLLLLSLLFLWFMTKMKHDFVLHFTINCEEFPTGTMNWPPASRWMRHVLSTYNNCGADNCTASWREQNETIPFTTTAQTPPSHVILFFYDCGVGGGAVWLTDLQKEPHKKSLKIFLMFFSSSSDLQKNLFLFFRMEKRRKTQSFWAWKWSLCAWNTNNLNTCKTSFVDRYCRFFFQVLYSPSSKAWGWTYVKRLSEEVRDGVVASSQRRTVGNILRRKCKWLSLIGKISLIIICERYDTFLHSIIFSIISG